MEKVICREFFRCKEKECPAYLAKDFRCWLTSGTHCRDEIQGKFLEKIEMCLGCKVFKSNMDATSMKETLRILDRQLKEYRRMVKQRDRELEDMSLELTLSLSEVFEALKKSLRVTPR